MSGTANALATAAAYRGAAEPKPRMTPAMQIAAGSELEITSKGPLVLLFYDGYELKAAPGLLGAAYSQARRAARYAYRTLRRRQVRTGFYTAFLGLKRGLDSIGCDVRVNAFGAARARPAYPIGMAGYPSVIEKVRLPNPIIFGHGDFGDARSSAKVAADPRFKRLIMPGAWAAEYYRPACGEKLFCWPTGIDTETWADASDHPKTHDVLVYDKIRWHREDRVPRILNRILAGLDARGLSYQVLRYGHHHQSQFAKAVRESRAMVFICEHETQGLAYQEAMSAGLPVLAWDEGELVDPHQRALAPPDLEVSAVPYFDDRCGMRFKLADYEQTLDAFWARWNQFQPRAYVCEALSYERTARDYLTEYAAIAGQG